MKSCKTLIRPPRKYESSNALNKLKLQFLENQHNSPTKLKDNSEKITNTFKRVRSSFDDTNKVKLEETDTAEEKKKKIKKLLKAFEKMSVPVI